jgi:hypothetical protein
MLDPGKNHAQFGLAAFLAGVEFSRLSSNWSIYLSTVSDEPPPVLGFAIAKMRRGATTSHMAFDMP